MSVFQKGLCSFLCDMAVNFLFIASSATGTGMLVNSALISKEIMVSSEVMLFPLRPLANPLLSVTMEKFLSVYLCKFPCYEF